METNKLNKNFTCHRGPVTCAVEIPGTNKIITSAYDGATAIFNPDTDDVKLLGYHEHLVNRVSVNEEGTFAATSSSDYNIYIWDIEKEALHQVLQGHDDDVEDFVFISDHLGASVSRDWRIIIWDLTNGSIRRIILGHEKDVLSVSYLNGKLYTAGDDMTLRVWDLETGKELAKMGPFETETDTCAVDPLMQRIILGCDDGIIRVFELGTWKLVTEIEGHTSAIKKVAVSPQNGDIMSAAYDQQILVWDAKTFEKKIKLESHSSLWERSFNWSSNGSRIVAGTFDGTVLVWDVATGQRLHEIGKNEAADGNPCFNDIASMGNDEVAVVSDDGHVRIGKLSATHSEWIETVTPDSGRVLMNGVTADPSRDCVIAGSHDQRVHFFCRKEGTMTQEHNMALGEGPINCIRISNHEGQAGNGFVACYSGNVVQVSPNGEVINTIAAHENAVKALRLHPTRTLGVSCCAGGDLATWDFDGNIYNEYKGHTAIIDDCDIDPTGTYIASAGRDFTLKIHDLESAVLLHSIHLGRRSPKALIFLTKDIVIVTNYWGELLRVDLRDESVTRATIAKNGISSIAQHGEYLVATSYDGAIYLVNPDDLSVANTLRSMIQQVEEPVYA